MADFNGQNIKFLQGSYSKLKNLNSSEVGAFYITNDTHEMFLGLEADKAPVALNRWVDVKDDWAAIQATTDYKQHPGKIYYAIKENILCTYTGENNTSNGWVQINPDTDTNTYVSELQIEKGEVVTDAQGKKSVTYKLDVIQKDVNNVVIENSVPTATLTITDDLVTSLITDVKVGLQATENAGVVTVSTTGHGSDENTTFTLTGADGVNVSAKDNNIEINGTTYDLVSEKESDVTSVVLLGSNNVKKKVSVTGDSWIETKSNTGNNGIVLEHKAPVQDGAAAASTVSKTAPTIDLSEHTFKALTAVNVDAAGHVVSADLSTFTIPNTVYDLLSTEVDMATKADGAENFEKITTEVILKDGKQVEEKVTLKVAHTIEVDGETKLVRNGEHIGDFYSASMIDTKLKAVDAMSYKGVVDGKTEGPSVTSPLPTEANKVQIGDTYKASADFSFLQNEELITVSAGDILIANGQEDEPEENGNAYIKQGTLYWDHIESGADADTTYTFEGDSNSKSIVLHNNVNQTNQSIVVNGDTDYISTTVSKGAVSISHNTKTVEAETVDKSATLLNYAEVIEVVTGIEEDTAGHLDKVTTTKYALPGADYVEVNKANNEFAIKNASNAVKGKLTVVGGDKLEAVSEMSTDKTELTVTVNHDKIATTTAPVAKQEDNPTILLSGTNNTFVVVDSLKDDGYGHITDITTKTVTIDKETTYNLVSEDIADNVLIHHLKNNKTQENQGSIKLTSETLVYSATAKGTSIDLVWGSF